MSKLEIQLGETYKILDGPGACNFYDGIAFCGIDGRFCLFLLISQYQVLMNLEDEVREECLTPPNIPNSPIGVWWQLRKRKSLLETKTMTNLVSEDDYYEIIDLR